LNCKNDFYYWKVSVQQSGGHLYISKGLSWACDGS
jgi:hypothetical protein